MRSVTHANSKRILVACGSEHTLLVKLAYIHNFASSNPKILVACAKVLVPNEKKSRGGSGFPVTEKSRTVTGQIRKLNFVFKLFPNLFFFAQKTVSEPISSVLSYSLHANHNRPQWFDALGVVLYHEVSSSSHADAIFPL